MPARGQPAPLAGHHLQSDIHLLDARWKDHPRFGRMVPAAVHRAGTPEKLRVQLFTKRAIRFKSRPFRLRLGPISDVRGGFRLAEVLDKWRCRERVRLHSSGIASRNA